MGIGLFKRWYTVKKHGEQKMVNGHAVYPYSFVRMKLDVQPLSSDEMRALPEGERTVKRVKSFGSSALASADELAGIPGDRLWYRKQWYECKSSDLYDITMLRHWLSNWVLCPKQDKPPPEISGDEPVEELPEIELPEGLVEG